MNLKAKFFGAGAGLTLMALGTAAMLYEPGAAGDKTPKITGWIHVFGCPRASKEDLTNNDLIIVFKDGTVAHLKVGKLTDEERAALPKLLGDVNGLNLIYACGSSS